MHPAKTRMGWLVPSGAHQNRFPDQIRQNRNSLHVGCPAIRKSVREAVSGVRESRCPNLHCEMAIRGSHGGARSNGRRPEVHELSGADFFSGRCDHRRHLAFEAREFDARCGLLHAGDSRNHCSLKNGSMGTWPRAVAHVVDVVPVLSKSPARSTFRAPPAAPPCGRGRRSQSRLRGSWPRRGR